MDEGSDIGEGSVKKMSAKNDDATFPSKPLAEKRGCVLSRLGFGSISSESSHSEWSEQDLSIDSTSNVSRVDSESVLESPTSSVNSRRGPHCSDTAQYQWRKYGKKESQAEGM